jgi:iron complex outermembrane receptor protein
MKTKIIYLLAGLCFLYSYSKAEDVNLEKIVVTPYRYEETLSKTASSVTVITPGEIKSSNAKKVVDVLRPIPGVTVRDFYGNGVTSSVDIAGFGGQAPLNVLVLIDGRRVNDVDQSGVDWSQIPLEQVERIEVMRGGSGGVLYGENASGGVISIITKKGMGKPKLNTVLQYGSYDMNGQKVSFSGSLDNRFSFWLSGGRQATNGYRNNTFDKTRDFSSKLEYSFNDALAMRFNSGFHTSTYGMPGALYQINIDQQGRRFARYAKDHANNKDYYFVLGAKGDSHAWGKFDLDFTYRHKDTDSYFLTSGLFTQKNKIETYGLAPKYTLANSIFGQENKLIAGLDLWRVFFNSNKFDQIIVNDLKNLTSINKTSVAGYLQNEFSLFKQFALVGGYRYEAASFSFGYHDNTLPPWNNPDIDNKVRFTMQAFNTGLVYTYQEDSSAFLDVGKTFRFPEVDEFTFNDANWQQQLNTNLKPQRAINYQIGIRHRFSERLKGTFSLFRMNIKDELYFKADGGPTGFGQNENYDKTVHEGLESSLDIKLSDLATFFGNYTFTNAFFRGGQFADNEIPLVPRHKGSVGLRFIFPKNITFNITGTYTGKRYYLNDQANAFSRLNGYMVADANVSWRHKELIVTFGICNLFNKKYSEQAGVLLNASGIYPAGSKFYFPSPERNFSLKVDYTF